MMDKVALDIKHITKEYRLYDTQLDRIKESFHPFKKSYHRKFFALKDVNIKIMEGEKVGIIGANGAGKSTLLKIVTEVLNPTEGELVINGKIAALLELGAGFNQDYTGIENIRLNGTLMGYTDEEIEEKMQKIIEFADIGEFIDQPVKSYSSGMFVRLAFATQIFSEPDILIVDEALSVGDIRFQQKCYRAMESIMKDKTVVLVTHDTAAVTRFCQRVIWINHGQVMYDGDTAEGLRLYQEFLINQAIEDKHEEPDSTQVGNAEFELMNQLTTDKTEQEIDTNHATDYSNVDVVRLPEIPIGMHKIGNRDATITHCGLLNEKGEVLEYVEPEQTVSLVSRVKFAKKIERPLYGLTLKDRLGNIMFSLNSEMLNVELPKMGGYMELNLKFDMPQLNRGNYTISVAVADGYQQDHVQLCWIDDACVFKVRDREQDLPGFFYISKGSITFKNLENKNEQ